MQREPKTTVPGYSLAVPAGLCLQPALDSAAKKVRIGGRLKVAQHEVLGKMKNGVKSRRDG